MSIAKKSGKINLFEMKPGSSEIIESEPLTTISSTSFGSAFGRSMAVAGNKLAVSAPLTLDGLMAVGKVYLFDTSLAGGNLSAEEAAFAVITSPEENVNFGTSIIGYSSGLSYDLAVGAERSNIGARMGGA